MQDVLIFIENLSCTKYRESQPIHLEIEALLTGLCLYILVTKCLNIPNPLPLLKTNMIQI